MTLLTTNLHCIGIYSLRIHAGLFFKSFLWSVLSSTPWSLRGISPYSFLFTSGMLCYQTWHLILGLDFTPEYMNTFVFGSETILSTCLEAYTPLNKVGKVIFHFGKTVSVFSINISTGVQRCQHQLFWTSMSSLVVFQDVIKAAGGSVLEKAKQKLQFENARNFLSRDNNLQ